MNLSRGVMWSGIILCFVGPRVDAAIATRNMASPIGVGYVWPTFAMVTPFGQIELGPGGVTGLVIAIGGLISMWMSDRRATADRIEAKAQREDNTAQIKEELASITADNTKKTATLDSTLAKLTEVQDELAKAREELADNTHETKKNRVETRRETAGITQKINEMKPQSGDSILIQIDHPPPSDDDSTAEMDTEKGPRR